MYICRDCRKVYEDEEVEHIEEVPYSHPLNNTRFTVETTCDCRGEIAKAVECEGCGEWTTEERELCIDCINKYKNIDTMLEIGADYEESISLNGFLISAFTKDDIEQMLIDALKRQEKQMLDNAINKYCEEDLDYFYGVAERKWKEER